LVWVDPFNKQVNFMLALHDGDHLSNNQTRLTDLNPNVQELVQKVLSQGFSYCDMSSKPAQS